MGGRSQPMPTEYWSLMLVTVVGAQKIRLSLIWIERIGALPTWSVEMPNEMSAPCVHGSLSSRMLLALTSQLVRAGCVVFPPANQDQSCTP